MSELALAGPKVVFCQIGAGRYAIAADIVTRGVMASRIVQMPWVSDGLAGFIVVDNHVVPVIDPHALVRGRTEEKPASGAILPLDPKARARTKRSAQSVQDDRTRGLVPRSREQAREMILVGIAGHSYAVMIDRILGIAVRDGAEPEFCEGDDIRELDIATGIEGLRTSDENPLQPNAEGLVPTASLPKFVAAPPRLAGAALEVETENASHLVALDDISHALNSLPATAVPDPNPLFAGAAFYQDAWIPVVRLDGLLAESPRPQGELGGYVVVATQNDSIAVGVKRIVGVSGSADASRFICLSGHLDRMLTEVAERDAGEIATAAPDIASDDKRYLLFDLGSQCCAVDIDEVERVLGDCHVVSTPPSLVVGPAGITVVAGRALPLLDASALLGVDQPVGSATGYVVLGRSLGEGFVVPVSRVGAVVSIPDEACARAPDEASIGAIAVVADQTVWILSMDALVRRSGWTSDAA
jgi:chemotaxis signal transduction protein